MYPRAPAVVLFATLIAASVLALPAAAAPRDAPAWRVLVYLDADNNLDVYAGAHPLGIVQVDLDELMAVGSAAGVDVFVLVDRWDGPARLYKVLPGTLVEQTAWPLGGSEVNMGDPATLRSFAAFTFKASKAEHTWLTFWDHGSPDYVAWDDNPGTGADPDTLTHAEVVRALDGYAVDVIAADECLVAQIEVAYEYRATGLDTDYLVASEGYTGWRGYPYDAILEELVRNPQMSARELAATIVRETQAFLSEPPYMGEEVNTHAAVDLRAVPDLAAALRGLTDLLIPDMKSHVGMVTAARGGAQISYGNAAINVIDLRRFVEGIADATRSPQIRAAAIATLDALSDAVVAIQATQSTERMAGGLGITLPTQSWGAGAYARYAFAGEGWLSFLEAYWAAVGA